MTSDAAARWASALERWAIPDEIAARATRPPWELPVARFVGRADDATAHPGGWSFDRAASALGPGGSVLDVGVGAGAASLPLAERVGPTGSVTGVDASRQMLDAFRELAARTSVGSVATVEGRWPDVTGQVEPHDVVVAHHVVYNVADIEPFLDALTGRARARVVVELPPYHPMTWANPLWEHFWGLQRPETPTAEDFVEVVRSRQVRDLVVYRWSRRDPDLTPLPQRAALVAQRLCLPPEREGEVATFLEDLPLAQVRGVVTVAWSGGS